MNLSSFPDISIVPILPEHAAALATLVEQNREHLQAYLPGVLPLAYPDGARAYLAHACERAALGEVLEWHVFSGTAFAAASA